MGCRGSKVKDPSKERKLDIINKDIALQQKQPPNPVPLDDSYQESRSSTIEELSSNYNTFNTNSVNLKNSFHLSIKSSNYLESSNNINSNLGNSDAVSINKINPRLQESLNSATSIFLNSGEIKKTFSQITNNSQDSISTNSVQQNRLSLWKLSINKYIQSNQQTKQIFVKPLEVLYSAISICEKYFIGEVHPVLLASLALSESKGELTMEKFDETAQCIRYGLCQLNLVQAQFLQQQYQVQCPFNIQRGSDLYKLDTSLYFTALALKHLVIQIKKLRGKKSLDARQFGEYFERTIIYLYHNQQFKISEIVRAIYDDSRSQSSIDDRSVSPAIEGYGDKENIKPYLYQTKSSQEIQELKYKDKPSNDKTFIQIYTQNKQHLYGLWEAIKASPNILESHYMHIVQEGESVLSIARACEIGIDQLVAFNHEIDMSSLQAGDCIALPVTKVLPRIHIVQRHQQSLYDIARNYEVSYKQLRKANPTLKDGLNLKPGFMVTVPGLQSYFSPSDTISSFSSSNQSRNVVLPHLIQKGDNLNQIANIYNVSVKEIIRANRGLLSSDLRRGDTLYIPLK